MGNIEIGDKWHILDAESKFSHNIMTVTKILKDNRKRERDDLIYFETQLPVDGYKEHVSRAWWFLDYCIKVE